MLLNQLRLPYLLEGRGEAVKLEVYGVQGGYFLEGGLDEHHPLEVALELEEHGVDDHFYLEG